MLTVVAAGGELDSTTVDLRGCEMIHGREKKKKQSCAAQKYIDFYFVLFPYMCYFV